MIKYNDTYIIGIDHGYGNLKTANTVTASGVKVHDNEPPFKKELLEYDGKFICIGENHKSFTADKTIDMDNYYLTLYGIGKELSLAGITEANIHLAVGLPLMWYSEQRDRFSEYMLQNENVKFIYNNKRYSVHLLPLLIAYFISFCCHLFRSFGVFLNYTIFLIFVQFVVFRYALI